MSLARKVSLAGLALQSMALVAQLGLSLAGSPRILDPWVLYGGFVLFGAAHLAATLGLRRGVAFALIVLAVTTAAETFAQSHGLFGVRYHYMPEAWPRLVLGALPALVPWMWLAGMVPTYVLASRLTEASRERLAARGVSATRPTLTLIQAFVGGSAMTLWDLLLDPVSVRSGLWRWQDGPYPFFDVPSENFASWWIGTVATHAILRVAIGTRPELDRDLTPVMSYAMLGVLYLVVADDGLLQLLALLMIALGALTLRASPPARVA